MNKDKYRDIVGATIIIALVIDIAVVMFNLPNYYIFFNTAAGVLIGLLFLKLTGLDKREPNFKLTILAAFIVATFLLSYLITFILMLLIAGVYVVFFRRKGSKKKEAATS